MGTTNYIETFITVAPDCPVTESEVPPSNAERPSVAALQYELIAEHPYRYTSDDVLFLVHARRNSIPQENHAEARAQFFARSQACLRASPLGKRYGWGTHHDDEGKVALIALGSPEYERLANSPEVTQKAAMRSRR